MYDEVMQLIALAKNDEVYFKRIDELKQKQLELAQVMEIAKTLGEADKYLAGARQKAEQLIFDAEKEAEVIKATATNYIKEQKEILEKTKAKKQEVTEKVEVLDKTIAEYKLRQVEAEKSIEEHRKLTAARTEEMDKAAKVRSEFETKLKQIKEIAAH